MITDSAGAKARQAQYAPFGGILLAQTCDPTVPADARGFIGERFDADAGLQYLNARYYDPELGLFLQPDWFEVTEAGVGTNRYAYSANDPVNLRDPGGNVVPLVVGIIVVGSYLSSTDPANAPGPNDEPLPATGGARAVGVASAMAVGIPTVAAATSRCMSNAVCRATVASAEVVDVANADSLIDLFPGPTFGSLKPSGRAGRGGAPNRTVPDGVSFGRNANQDYHVWRHVEDELGMSCQRVQDAVVADLPPVADLTDGLNVRFVNVDGVRLQYNAFKQPDGIVNIGRIHEAN